MRNAQVVALLCLAVPGALLLGFSSCLGPNPGLFISSSAANAAVFTLVNAFLTELLGPGGG